MNILCAVVSVIQRQLMSDSTYCRYVSKKIVNTGTMINHVVCLKNSTLF